MYISNRVLEIIPARVPFLLRAPWPNVAKWHYARGPYIAAKQRPYWRFTPSFSIPSYSFGSLCSAGAPRAQTFEDLYVRGRISVAPSRAYRWGSYGLSGGRRAIRVLLSKHALAYLKNEVAITQIQLLAAPRFLRPSPARSEFPGGIGDPY